MEGIDIATVASDSAAFDNLDNAQQETVLQREATDKGKVTPPAQSAGDVTLKPGDPGYVAPAQSGGNGEPKQPLYAPAWNKLKEKGVEVPETFFKGDFGGKDEFDELQRVILENTELEEPSSDPFVKTLMKVPADKRDEFITAYVEQNRFFQLPAKEGIRAWYENQVDDKNERTYSDEDIDKYIGGLSKIQMEREWAGVVQQGKERQKEIFGIEEETPEQRNANIETQNKEIRAYAKKVAAEYDKMEDFGGIPLTPEIKKLASQNFELLTTINPKTGRPHILSLLADDNKLREVVLQMTLHDSKHINKYLSNFKEDFKEELLGALDISSKPRAGGQTFVSKQDFTDMD
jgi:hypothetical protein